MKNKQSTDVFVFLGFAAILVGFFLAIGSLARQRGGEGASDAFRWLANKKDSASLENVKTAFAEELKPSNRVGMSPIGSPVSKNIWSVGQYRNSMLVIIRSLEDDYPHRDFYTAYNFNRNSGKISKILAKDTFWRWTFYKLARFDETPISDVAFTYYDCMDCEAAKILASFQFDVETATWRIRPWGLHEGILVDSSQFGDESWTYDCLFKVRDLNGDGFDDVAVTCRGTGPLPDSVSDSTEFYTVAKGIAQEREIKNNSELTRINKILCEGIKNSKVCHQK